MKAKLYGAGCDILILVVALLKIFATFQHITRLHFSVKESKTVRGLTLKITAIRYFETSIAVHQPAWRNVPEDFF